MPRFMYLFFYYGGIMVNILDMHRRHGGFAWRVHDERFRRVRALAPSMPWHLTNWDLAMDAIQTVVVRQSDTLQPPFRFDKHPNQQPARGPSGFCFAYNDTCKCGRVGCRFAHLCEHCDRKGYPPMACRIGKNVKTSSSPTLRLNHYLSGYTPYRRKSLVEGFTWRRHWQTSIAITV